MQETPRIIRSALEWMDLRAGFSRDQVSIGFVPTMGALHEGHAELCRRSVRENAVTLVSIFVNPTQFDNDWDFANYPQTLEADLKLLRECGVAFVFAPSVDEMYPDRRSFIVSETQSSLLLEGEHRPGHFEGMLTVVAKLLSIAGADRSYFGEKDWQQLHLVRRLREAMFLPGTIVACPTIRERDGLAMSSRNRRLSAAERALAPRFHEVLAHAGSASEAVAELAALGFVVDYVREWDGRRLGAVRLGSTRLIDNIPWPPV
jgi:pantoate--beta-alanine ligase